MDDGIDWKHPKLQSLLSSNARKNIELQLVEDILEEGSALETTCLDMEYWHTLHDKLAAVVADAERYRYLRDRNSADVLEKTGDEAGCWIDCEVGEALTLLTGKDADDAIDKARSKKCPG